MGQGGATVWLLIRDVDRDKWSRSPCPSVIASLNGQLLGHVYVPGLLIGFPRVSDAARAALRCYADLERTFPDEEIPPMVLTTSGDPKHLSIVAASASPRMIVLADEVGRYLAGEPVEVVPGPQVKLEGGGVVGTQLLGTNSHNIGWALPTVDLGSAKSIRSDRASAPTVINVHMKPKRWFRLAGFPWKFSFIMAFLAIGLLGAYRFVQQLVIEMGKSPQTSEVTEGDTELVELPLSTRLARLIFSPPTDQEEESSEVVLDSSSEENSPFVEISSPTPVPLGYGTVIIRTEPIDARIFLNGELVGKKSPTVLEHKSNQEMYELIVKRKGYKEYTNIFNVVADQEKIFEVKLLKRVARR